MHVFFMDVRLPWCYYEDMVTSERVLSAGRVWLLGGESGHGGLVLVIIGRLGHMYAHIYRGALTCEQLPPA